MTLNKTNEHQKTQSNSPPTEDLTKKFEVATDNRNGEPLPPSRSATITYRGTRYQIPNLALLAMLVAILAPTVMYSVNLHGPTAAELLIAICIGLFSSVLALWVLDITAVLPFRSGWVSKSIWGTAIVSILGTSVGVYKDAFSDRAYPLEGRWELSIWRGIEGELVDRREVILMYSTTAETYWGFSEARKISEQWTDSKQEDTGENGDLLRHVLWIEVVRLDVNNSEMELRIHDQESDVSFRITNLTISPKRTVASGASGQPQTLGSYHIELTRPK